MRKPDPVDTKMQIDAIRSASFFIASLYAEGCYQQKPAATVAEALKAAAQLQIEFNSHRRAMIYAVSQDGASTFITNDLIQQLRGT